jgi:hypothetical protein
MVGFSTWPIGDWTLKGLEALIGSKGSSLVKLVPLFEHEVTGSLIRMRSLFEQMARPLMDLHEGQGYPQDDLPVLLLRVPD